MIGVRKKRFGLYAAFSIRSFAIGAMVKGRVFFSLDGFIHVLPRFSIEVHLLWFYMIYEFYFIPRRFADLLSPRK